MPPPIPAVKPHQHENLLRVRQRLLLHRRAVDAFWGLSSGLMFAAWALLGTRLLGEEASPWWPLLAGVAAATATVGARAWRHRWVAWDSLRVARYIDREAGLAEQVSTAVEFAGHHDPVVRALHADAMCRLAGIDPKALTPWRTPRRLGGTLLLGAVAVGFAAMVPLSPIAGPLLGSSLESSGAPRQPAASADAVRVLADQLDGEARRSRDSYLASLADQLRSLADEAGDGPVDATDLQRILERLAEASGGAVGSEDLRAMIASTDARLAEGPQNSEGAGPRPAAPPRMQVGGPQEAMDFGSVFTQTQEADPLRAQGAGGDGAVGRDTNFGVVDPDSVEEPNAAQMMDFDGVPGGAGESIGAADRSGAGASRVGGRGTEALDGEALAADLDNASTEAIAISGLERDDGRRIEVEIPPMAEWEGYDPSQFTVGRWRAAPVAPQPDRSVPLTLHSAAARYFNPSQATAQQR